jgi:hypothetical protein
MARRPAKINAHSALLVCDPRASRQFGAGGAVLLWRDAGDSGRRRGLLCVPSACSHADCFAVHVWLGEVHSALSSVSKSGRAFQFVLDADHVETEARLPVSEAFAAYDTDGGGVVAAEGSEKSPLIDWLVRGADDDVLTHLRTPLMQRELAAGRVMRARPPRSSG